MMKNCITPCLAGLLAMALLGACAKAGIESIDPEAPVNSENPANSGNTPNNGQCPPDSCDQGEVICIGLSEIFRCDPLDNGCNAFTLQESCDSGLRCVAGQCQGENDCVDNDGDGHGRNCADGPDCADDDADRFQGANEVCDGVDNNCDGQVDEGETCTGNCDAQECDPGARECVGISVRECMRDQNNCGFWGQTVSCGSGCTDGNCDGCEDPDNDGRGPGCAQGNDCDQNNIMVYEGANELCNGRDENCDGENDESFTDLSQPCTVGIGACAREGIFVCTSGGFATMCDAEPGQPSEEICGDNIDNDCDGDVDSADSDINVGTVCVAGEGVCAREGIVTCQGGQPTCNANPGLPQSDEICGDGQDNDCDGDTDAADSDCDQQQGTCDGNNDRSSTGTSLPVGQTINAALCNASQVDWYKLGSVSTGQTINLTMTPGFTNTNTRVRFEIYGVDGNAITFRISSISENPRESISYNATTTGEYYVRMLHSPEDGFPASTTFSYSLSR